jgi:prepilin-type N-terminal cleavage/methylation domain-containing protein
VNPRSRPANDGTADGFTIVEVLVAVTVLVVAMLGAALLFENAIVASGNTRNRVVAANLATQQMETVRGMAADPTKFALIPQNETVYAGPDQKVGPIQFTVTQDVSFVGTSSTTSSCDTPGPTSGQVVQVDESVTWPDMAGTQPVRSVTTLSPPVGVYSATAGAIGVKVTDASSSPADNVAVQVSGGPSSVPVGQTTAEGCAYFFPLDPGTYTVTVVEGTGVGDQEVVAPVQTASVSVAQTTALQFRYDSPATIVATVPSPTNTPGAPPYATGMSLSVANTGVQLYGHFSFTESTTSDVTTSPSLFPYSSGYVVFAGNCTDNNPLGKDNSRNPFYPTSTPVPVAVTPGGSSSATVPLYPLTAHVQNGAGAPVASATMTSTETSFAPPYTAVCLNGTAAATVPTLGLVTSNATGDTVTAMPLGHWTIQARSGTKTGSVNVWIKPDGVYGVSGTGAATTKFTGPVVVVVS